MTNFNFAPLWRSTVGFDRLFAMLENEAFATSSEHGFPLSISSADYVQVTSANQENGLLQIRLVREIPEAMKPRRIEIGSGSNTNPVDSRKVA